MNLKYILEKLVFGYYRMVVQSLFTIWPARGVRYAFYLFASPRKSNVRPREQSILREAIQATINIKGIRINTYRWGNGTKKALLIHGWEGHAGNMGGFIEPLNQAGYEVIAFDGPAHGKSTGNMTNLFEFASVTEYFLKEYAPEVMVTHSFGSSAGVLALSRNPDIHVKHLIMFTAMNRLLDAIKGFARVMGISQKDLERLIDYLEDLFQIKAENLETATLTRQINVDHKYLFHSPGDRLIPIENAHTMAAKNPDLKLYLRENLGHYRILWDEATLDIFRDIIRE